MIEYKLLNNQTAVLITRQPVAIYDELEITFIGAPKEATAIFDTADGAYYRKLASEKCSLPVNKLSGDIRVAVAILDGTTPIKRWECEELKATALKDGSVLIMPNDLNLPKVVANLRIENDSIRSENANITKELNAIKKKLDDILNAYDFT